jgi:hypothetical protein
VVEVEAFYVAEGAIDFMVSGNVVPSIAGQIMEIPIGTLHAFKNNNDKPARMLIAVAPSGLEKMFREVGQPVKLHTDFAPVPTPEDIRKLLTVAPRYGIEIKLPH